MQRACAAKFAQNTCTESSTKELAPIACPERPASRTWVNKVEPGTSRRELAQRPCSNNLRELSLVNSSCAQEHLKGEQFIFRILNRLGGAVPFIRPRLVGKFCPPDLPKEVSHLFESGECCQPWTLNQILFKGSPTSGTPYSCPYMPYITIRFWALLNFVGFSSLLARVGIAQAQLLVKLDGLQDVRALKG